MCNMICDRSNPYLLSALMTGLLFFQACTIADNHKGSFSIEIGGDITHSLSGNAVFGSATDPDSDRPGFALNLVTVETRPGNRLLGEALYLAILQSGRPQPGTYDIVNPDASRDRLDSAFWGYAQFDQEPYVTFVTWDGTITITTSTEDELSGTIEMEARGYDFTESPIELMGIQITGEFHSQGGYTYIPSL